MWLLVTGYWDDSGQWDDTGLWYDGPYGTLSPTEGQDIAAFTGTVPAVGILGILAAIEGADHAAFTGNVTIVAAAPQDFIRRDYGWFEHEPEPYRATEKRRDYSDQ